MLVAVRGNDKLDFLVVAGDTGGVMVEDWVSNGVKDPEGVGVLDMFGAENSNSVAFVDADASCNAVADAAAHTDAVDVVLRPGFEVTNSESFADSVAVSDSDANLDGFADAIAHTAPNLDGDGADDVVANVAYDPLPTLVDSLNEAFVNVHLSY